MPKKTGRTSRAFPREVKPPAGAEPRASSASTPVIAGVGASAGGLEALTQLLQHLPARPGAAFVLVQHLDPTHESILPSLLARATAMPVGEAKDGTRIEADQVHVIPPGMDITIADGHLRLQPRPERHAPHMPLDIFLRTLAQVQGSRAIAVILSGTGSDGTLGCKAVKTAGGIAFAQDPTSAKYDGMPKSAIAGGCVDFVLPPEGIAREIARLAREPYLRVPAGASPPPPKSRGRGSFDDRPVQRIFALLKKATGADFTCYRKTTLMRRIQRRMVLHDIRRLADYARYLEGEPSEVRALHHDLLINVTSFFRDREAFEALSRSVLPRVLEGRTAEKPVRVWVPGCATGEEAYSVAMCLLEGLSDLPSNPPLQVFATDLSETAVEKARAGVYLESIAADVSPERLLRFFVKVDGRYQVSKTIRDLIVFARQDLTRDPPFSKIDLISCRNVLIYLEPSLQKKVLATFHYALDPGGFLVLGKSETVGASETFELVDREHKIYAKAPTANPHGLHLAGTASPRQVPADGRQPAALSRLERRWDVEREAERLLLGRYAPASVLVNDKEQVFHFRGDTEAYLGHGPGAASFNLMTMARKGLVLELQRLLKEARAKGGPRRKRGLVFRHRGRSRRVDMEVIPIKGPASGERCFMVVFGGGRPVTQPVSVPRGRKAAAQRIEQLEQEAEALRHFHHAIQDEQAASNEELQSANEEVLSSNEELQSINEELETAKEELLSTNEELLTLNEELRNRNLDLGRLNDDLDNFLASSTLPQLMLGPDLGLRRFTPAAAKLFHLVGADIGRPLRNLRMSGIDSGELEAQALNVIEAMSPAERELQDEEGRWWRLHLRPYRTRDNKIEGVVLLLVDIDALKHRQEVVEEARDFANAIVDTARQPMLVLGTDLRVRRANESFYGLFRVSPQETEGASVYELGNGQWDVPALRTLLEDVLSTTDSFEGYTLAHEFPSIGARTMRLNGRRLRQSQSKEEMILLAMEDVTEAEELEARRAELLRHTELAAASSEVASRLKDEFVATASHELRGPLNAMVQWVHLLGSGSLDAETTARGMAALDRNLKAQTRLVEELLDMARLVSGKLQLAIRMVELGPVVEAALEATQPTALAKGVDLAWSGTTSEAVLGDPDRLQQVFWNLLSNAVKFTPRGGTVAVRLGRVGTNVQVTVRDNGEGIAASFLPHVFDRFRQADSGLSRRQGGLGLGLAIVRQLVEMHGGSVRADSPGEGRGSTFEVSLPVPALRRDHPAAARAEPETADPRTAPEPTLIRGVRVLVVEDDPDSRESLTTVLEQSGAAVTGAASAGEALLALSREVPDVLLSDVGLPDKDGYELIRAIRNLPPERGGQIPAIALTAYAAAADRRATTLAGFQAHLPKPAEPAALVAAVASLAGRSRQS